MVRNTLNLMNFIQQQMTNTTNKGMYNQLCNKQYLGMITLSPRSNTYPLVSYDVALLDQILNPLFIYKWDMWQTHMSYLSFRHLYEDSFILDLWKSEAFKAFSNLPRVELGTRQFNLYIAFMLSLELETEINDFYNSLIPNFLHFKNF